MIDPVVDEGKRNALADETRKLIESHGELKHADNWGLRNMAYEIEQRTEADYRFYRFVGTNPLLEQLDHTLKIADGALRFRVFRVDPEVPVTAPPPASAPHAPPRPSRSEDAPPTAPAAAPAAPAAPAAEGAAEAPPEAPAAPPAEAPAETPAAPPAEAPAEAPAEPAVPAEPAEPAAPAEPAETS